MESHHPRLYSVFNINLKFINVISPLTSQHYMLATFLSLCLLDLCMQWPAWNNIEKEKSSPTFWSFFLCVLPIRLGLYLLDHVWRRECSLLEFMWGKSILTKWRINNWRGTINLKGRRFNFLSQLLTRVGIRDKLFNLDLYVPWVIKWMGFMVIFNILSCSTFWQTQELLQQHSVKWENIDCWLRQISRNGFQSF